MMMPERDAVVEQAKRFLASLTPGERAIAQGRVDLERKIGEIHGKLRAENADLERRNSEKIEALMKQGGEITQLRAENERLKVALLDYYNGSLDSVDILSEELFGADKC